MPAQGGVDGSAISRYINPFIYNLPLAERCGFRLEIVSMTDIGLYVIITKPILSYRIIAEICAEENIRYLQLREKHLNDAETMAAGKELSVVLKNSRTNLIINDRPDIALLCGAAGYHLGQDDLPPQDALRIWRGSRTPLTGISTHNIEQLKQAVLSKPDYVGFGPVYPTPTKAVPDPDVGPESIKEALEAAGNIPVVCIGGLFPDNIKDVLSRGAANICLVRHLMESRSALELRSKIRDLQQDINRFRLREQIRTQRDSGSLERSRS